MIFNPIVVELGPRICVRGLFRFLAGCSGGGCEGGPGALGFLFEGFPVGGVVAGAGTDEELAVDPEAEADAQAVVGLALAGGFVELDLEVVEVEGGIGFGHQLCGSIVHFFWTAEGLGTGTAFGEVGASGGLLDEVFLGWAILVA